MKKVLIADDDQTLQKLWKERLARYGFEIDLLQAFSYAEARDLIKSHSRDLELVAVDGTLTTDADGLWLIEELVIAEYNGAVLAISGTDAMSRLLEQAAARALGEERSHACEKRFAAQHICRILGFISE